MKFQIGDHLRYRPELFDDDPVRAEIYKNRIYIYLSNDGLYATMYCAIMNGTYDTLLEDLGLYYEKL
jgi:hypothetical protein